MSDPAARFPPPSPARRIRGAALVAVVLALVATAVVATGAVLEVRTRGDVERLVRDDAVSPVPARILACENVMSEDCAARAARRIGSPVAWIAVPTGFTFSRFIAPPGGPFAEQSFVSSADPAVQIALTTNPRFPPSGVDLGTVSNPSDTATVWGTTDRELPALELVWTHDRTDYSLIVFAFTRADIPGRDAAEALWASIRYAPPTV